MPPPRCNICTENFNADTNFPMMMPCGRSLCRACVLRYLQNPNQRCFACAGSHPGVTVDRLQRNHDLLAASISPDSATSPSPSAGQSSGTLQLVLQELRGSKYNLHAHATATVLTVKNIIKDQYGFDPAGTRLIFSGRVLQDGLTLASYGVRTGNTVQMITDYLGGVSLGHGCQHMTRGDMGNAP